jgi:hypothetical protein
LEKEIDELLKKSENEIKKIEGEEVNLKKIKYKYKFNWENPKGIYEQGKLIF